MLIKGIIFVMMQQGGEQAFPAQHYFPTVEECMVAAEKALPMALAVTGGVSARYTCEAIVE
jgi:hypothetical protein